MDTFIPNMTLANIMHSNSNLLSFCWYTRHGVHGSSLATVSPFHQIAKGVVSVTVMRTRRS